MMGQKLLEVFRTQDRDFGKQELSLDEGRSCVVEYGPHGDEIFELSSGLLNDTIETTENDSHAGQVRDFGVADHERVNVKATRCKNPGDTGENPGFILDETIENMTLRRRSRRNWSLVEN